jgi:hypothetical protein
VWSFVTLSLYKYINNSINQEIWDCRETIKNKEAKQEIHIQGICVITLCIFEEDVILYARLKSTNYVAVYDRKVNTESAQNACVLSQRKSKIQYHSRDKQSWVNSMEDIPAEFAILLRNVSLHFIRHRPTCLEGIRHWLYIHELKRIVWRGKRRRCSV